MSFGKPAVSIAPKYELLDGHAVGRWLANVVKAGPEELAGNVACPVDARPRAFRTSSPRDDAVVVGRALVVA